MITPTHHQVRETTLAIAVRMSDDAGSAQPCWQDGGDSMKYAVARGILALRFLAAISGQLTGPLSTNGGPMLEKGRVCSPFLSHE